MLLSTPPSRRTVLANAIGESEALIRLRRLRDTVSRRLHQSVKPT